MIHKLVLAALALTLGWTASAEKIGLVDMQKAIQETTEGKKAKTELESDYNKKKKDLEKKEAEIRKMNDELEKKALVLSDEVKGKKQQEIQNEMRRYQESVAKNQMDIQKHERDLTQPIINKLRRIIEDVAKKDGYTMVLEKSDQLVLFAPRDADITDKVIKEYDGKK